MTDEQVVRSAGMSRRDVMKRGAVVGGAMVWAVPVVQSFTNPAGAVTIASPEEPQEPGPDDVRSISNVIAAFSCGGVAYVVKYDVDERKEEAVTNFNGQGKDCYQAAGGTVQDRKVKGGPDLVTFEPVFIGETAMSVTVTVGVGCVLTTVVAKCGNNATPPQGCNIAEIDPAAPSTATVDACPK